MANMHVYILCIKRISSSATNLPKTPPKHHAWYCDMVLSTKQQQERSVLGPKTALNSFIPKTDKPQLLAWTNMVDEVCIKPRRNKHGEANCINIFHLKGSCCINSVHAYIVDWRGRVGLKIKNIIYKLANTIIKATNNCLSNKVMSWKVQTWKLML